MATVVSSTPRRAPSLEQFPGDSYSNLRKLSEGLRGGRERYADRRCRYVGIDGQKASLTDKVSVDSSDYLCPR